MRNYGSPNYPIYRYCRTIGWYGTQVTYITPKLGSTI
jgi:hypothetical protein